MRWGRFRSICCRGVVCEAGFVSRICEQDFQDYWRIFGIRARSGGEVCWDGVGSCVFAVGVV